MGLILYIHALYMHTHTYIQMHTHTHIRFCHNVWKPNTLANR